LKITPAYLEEQRALHAHPRGYGGRGSKWASEVAQLATGRRIVNILDYGAGQGTLSTALRESGFKARDYDPAVFSFKSDPEPADLVTCTDCLEHVERECLDEVIAHIAWLARPWLFVVISLVPTDKKLSDGRQAHISLHPREWWLWKLGALFDLVKEIENRPEKQFVGFFRRKK